MTAMPTPQVFDHLSTIRILPVVSLSEPDVAAHVTAVLANAGLPIVEASSFRQMITRATQAYPNWSIVGTTLRTATTSTINNWSAISWHHGQFSEATLRTGMEINDRVGGGDSFASGLIYALLEDLDPQTAINYAAAHGALAMTTPGDTSMATLAEVHALAVGSGARIIR